MQENVGGKEHQAAHALERTETADQPEADQRRNDREPPTLHDFPMGAYEAWIWRAVPIMSVGTAMPKAASTVGATS